MSQAIPSRIADKLKQGECRPAATGPIRRALASASLPARETPPCGDVYGHFALHAFDVAAFLTQAS